MEVIVFIKSDFRLGKFYFSCSFSVDFCGNKIEIHLNIYLISDVNGNTTLDFVLFYQKIINAITPEFSTILLFPIEYPLNSNPVKYMMNEISKV